MDIPVNPMSIGPLPHVTWPSSEALDLKNVVWHAVVGGEAFYRSVVVDLAGTLCAGKVKPYPERTSRENKMLPLETVQCNPSATRRLAIIWGSYQHPIFSQTALTLVVVTLPGWSLTCDSANLRIRLHLIFISLSPVAPGDKGLLQGTSRCL